MDRNRQGVKSCTGLPRRAKEKAMQTNKNDALLNACNKKYEEFYSKLDSASKSCDKLSKNLRSSLKLATKELKIEVNSSEGLEAHQENNTEGWKKELSNYKKAKRKPNALYLKLKSITQPIQTTKNAIKRMTLRKDLIIPERKRISISDICSSQGKIILANSRRKFGEISQSSRNLAAYRGSKAELEPFDDKLLQGYEKTLQTSKNQFSVFAIYDKGFYLPKAGVNVKNASIKRQLRG